MKRTVEHLNFTRQRNSCVVEDFILPYSAVYLRIQKWTNYWDRATFAKVIVKNNYGAIFMAQGVEKTQYMFGVN